MLETTSSQGVSLGTPIVPPKPGVDDALYLYCVGDGAIEVVLGNIGIEGNEVFTIRYRDVSAVAHECAAEPYQSDDEDLVKKWVMTHQSVVDACWEKFGTVLPSGFDTIVKGGKETTAEDNLKDWLQENYEKLRKNLDRVRGKAEVGIQIFLDIKVLAQNIAETSEEIKRLNKEVKEKSPGMAYFFKQRIERELRKELERKADEYFRQFCSRIQGYADDIRVEKTKRTIGDKQMIMNLSALVQRDRTKSLGMELVKIKEMEGVDVRFTGPWPPYSFATSA